MNKELVSQEIKEPAAEPKLFGLPRNLVGALIGVLFFTVIFLLLKAVSDSPAFLALFFPGILAIDMLGLSDNANNVLTNSIAYMVSCLPSAILGSLIFSKKKLNRNIGLRLSLIYLIFSLCYGLLLVLFMND